MKNSMNWKLFGILLAASAASALMALPYTIALSPALTELFTPALVIAALVQTLVLFSIVIFIGLFLAKRVGFGLPILEGALQGEKQGGRLRSILGISVGTGILAGIAIILLSLLFPELSLKFLKAEMSIATWKAFLVSFYGGIGEEILCRLFLVSLLAWIFSKFRKTPEGRPTNGGIWLAIVVAAVLFGLGHLPITGDVAAITPAVVARAILLNGIPGVMFGWLYWKKGLESAIIAHFSTDIVIHVATPLVASVFI